MKPTNEQVKAALNYAEWPPAEGHAKVLAAEVRRLQAENAKLQSDFATSADAVLPMLELSRDKGRRVEALMGFSHWHMTIHEKGADGNYGPPIRARAPTFARAAAIALIRAKRAEKGQP